MSIPPAAPRPQARGRCAPSLGVPAVSGGALRRPVVRMASLPAPDTDWTARAACKGSDPDELFVTGAAQNKVKTRCFSCVVRTECLADALDNRVEFGVWGGMTERERRALLRRRPDVIDWRSLLLRARLEAQDQDPRGFDALVAAS